MVGVLLVAESSTNYSTDEDADWTKRRADQDSEPRTCDGILRPRSRSGCPVEWSMGAALLGSATAGGSSLLAPIAVDASGVEIVHPICAPARSWHRVFNLPSSAAAPGGVVGESQLFGAKVAVTGGPVVDRFELVVAPGHFGGSAGGSRTEGGKSVSEGQVACRC